MISEHNAEVFCHSSLIHLVISTDYNVQHGLSNKIVAHQKNSTSAFDGKLCVIEVGGPASQQFIGY
jgi:hypothetical protein